MPENLIQTCRAIADNPVFRIGVALAMGVPFVALAVMTLVVGGFSLLALFDEMLRGLKNSDDAIALAAMFAVFSSVGLAISGVAIRIAFRFDQIKKRSALRKFVLFSTAPAIFLFSLLILTTGTIISLMPFSVLVIVFLGTLA